MQLFHSTAAEYFRFDSVISVKITVLYSKIWDLCVCVCVCACIDERERERVVLCKHA